MISLIVAKSQNNVIGRCNDLPWYLPADLRHFKELTAGNTVVMGRNTFDSIVARIGKPLPERENIVLTHDRTFSTPGVQAIHNIDELDENETYFIIGGAEIYKLFIGRADRIYITEVNAKVEGDTFFPDVDPVIWQEVSRESHMADQNNQYDYDFVIYEKR